MYRRISSIYYRAELDIEQTAILEDQSRALGLRGDFEGQSDWFGGKVQQRATFIKTDDRDTPFRIKLERMEMKKSSRFSRLLGSRHLLQFKLSSKDLDGKNVFLYKRFVLLGRVFMCICAKDKKIYAIEVNEDYQRLPQEAQGDQFRMSLEEFLHMQNPLDLNQRKVSVAWPPVQCCNIDVTPSGRH